MSDEEDEIARELLADLSEAAGVALQPWIDKPLTTDMKQVQRARNVVLSLAEMLKNSKEPLPFGLMLQVVEAAYVIGKYCVTTPPIEKFLACERAAHARGGKAKPPRDSRFAQAVNAEAKKLKIDPAQRGAARFLQPGINKRLRKNYKVDYVQKLLKKHGFLTILKSS